MAPIAHIVLFRYRPTIAWVDLEAHFRDFASLQTRCVNAHGKPYMLSMRMGKNSSWENYGKGMTHAFVLEFATAEDRDYYLLKDGVHHEFSRQANEKGLIEDSVVVDFEDGRLFADATAAAAASTSFHGSCHCGQIEFSVQLERPQHVLCHCDTCKKLGGAPYSCNAVIPKDDLRITKGECKVYSYTGASGEWSFPFASKLNVVLKTWTGKSVLCYHCGNCTSHVYHMQMVNPSQVIVRTLLLDGGNKMGIAGEIFGEGKLGWVSDLRGALST